jgi:hypothetical protein
VEIDSRVSENHDFEIPNVVYDVTEIGCCMNEICTVFVLNKNAIYQVCKRSLFCMLHVLHLRNLQQLFVLLISIQPSLNLGLEK